MDVHERVAHRANDPNRNRATVQPRDSPAFAVDLAGQYDESLVVGFHIQRVEGLLHLRLAGRLEHGLHPCGRRACPHQVPVCCSAENEL